MIYLDTSLIIAVLTGEFEGDRGWAWLARQAPGSLATAQWTETEVSSALSLKVRTKSISVDDRIRALATWHRWRSESIAMLAVTATHFLAAARSADRYELGLRAGDALHLAVAAAAGHSLATLDVKMAKAALVLGMPVEVLS